MKLDGRGRVVALKSWPVRCGPPPPPKAPKPLVFPGPSQKPDSMTNAEWADLQAKLAKLHDDSEKLQAELNQAAPTNDPLPGLKVDQKSGACTPNSVASLRNAAKAGEAWAGEGAVSHWVREKGPGDKPPATPASLFSMAGSGLVPKPSTSTVSKDAAPPSSGADRTDRGID